MPFKPKVNGNFFPCDQKDPILVSVFSGVDVRKAEGIRSFFIYIKFCFFFTLNSVDKERRWERVKVKNSVLFSSGHQMPSETKQRNKRLPCLVARTEQSGSHLCYSPSASVPTPFSLTLYPKSGLPQPQWLYPLGTLDIRKSKKLFSNSCY